ncbi:RNA polymerase subunit sigma-70, partial [Streptomyces sp. SID7982]|nr:RNA polymerase subunit sigma-70 [Streptomyces sp. SID7982]
LAGGPTTMYVARVNGSPAVIAVAGDRVVGAVAFDVGDGKVAALYGIAAAHRLTRLDEAWRRHDAGVPVIDAW